MGAQGSSILIKATVRFYFRNKIITTAWGMANRFVNILSCTWRLYGRQFILMPDFCSPLRLNYKVLIYSTEPLEGSIDPECIIAQASFENSKIRSQAQ